MAQSGALRDCVNRRSRRFGAIDGDLGVERAEVIIAIGENDDGLFAGARRKVAVYPDQGIVERRAS
jgi:hypothetical protein